MIFSVVCVIVNVIIIFALTGKSIKKEVKKQYLYYVMNSYSNIFYMIITAVSVINNCKIENIFCSSLYGSESAQYFQIIFNVLIKNILITFSNLAYLGFILARYIKISSTKNIILKKFDSVSLTMFALTSLILSIFSNSHIYFEIETKQKFKFYDSIYQDSSQDQFRNDFTSIESTVFSALQYLKFILIDLLFFVLTIVIDCTLIRFIKKSMLDSNHNREVKKIAKQRTITMLVLNGINFLVLRSPSLIIDFYVFFFNHKTKGTKIQYFPSIVDYLVCRVFNFCESIKQVFYFLYMLSYLVQLFIFYKLDSNFKAGFKALKFCRNQKNQQI
jgi:hypothetical protein